MEATSTSFSAEVDEWRSKECDEGEEEFHQTRQAQGGFGRAARVFEQDMVWMEEIFSRLLNARMAAEVELQSTQHRLRASDAVIGQRQHNLANLRLELSNTRLDLEVYACHTESLPSIFDSDHNTAVKRLAEVQRRCLGELAELRSRRDKLRRDVDAAARGRSIACSLLRTVAERWRTAAGSGSAEDLQRIRTKPSQQGAFGDRQISVGLGPGGKAWVQWGDEWGQRVGVRLAAVESWAAGFEDKMRAESRTRRADYIRLEELDAEQDSVAATLQSEAAALEVEARIISAAIDQQRRLHATAAATCSTWLDRRIAELQASTAAAAAKMEARLRKAAEDALAAKMRKIRLRYMMTSAAADIGVARAQSAVAAAAAAGGVVSSANLTHAEPAAEACVIGDVMNKL